ncbi:MAG TPA: Ig-like domain-containing protein, partial [Mycobacteriales bacterium]|nr:Ig-like domain-containing protein [Mycobacteriales bacterium]
MLNGDSDPNDTPPNHLSASLVTTAAHGALVLSADGSFTYTPDANFNGTDSFTYRAIDDGGTDFGGVNASNTATVTLTVNPVNDAPVLDTIGNRTIDEQTLLTFTAHATDVDVPANALTFSLLGAPEGAVINAATGVFSWTPTEAQGPADYRFTVRVTDDGSPVMFDEELIAVTVKEVNVAPVLDAIGDKTIDEQTALTFTAHATDADLPANTLTFSLVGAPQGATISADTGAFSWTPTEAQGPASYRFTVRVTDSGTPTLSDEEAIAVTVKEVNVAPVLAPIGNKAVSEGELLSFTIGATDADLPANNLIYSATGLPAGATFDAATRTFSWMPTEPQGPAVYSVDFRVTDDGSPALSDDEAVSITVNEDANLDAGPQANDGRPDNFRFVASGANLQGYLNDALVFVRSIASLVDGVSVTGSGDDDSLTIDFSGGNPIPVAGIRYDGAGQHIADTLTLSGSAGSVIYTATDAHSGTVNVDGRIITYSNLEPIHDGLAVANRTIVFGPGPDNIAVSVDAARTTVMSPSSETIDFANPDASGTVTIRAGDGNDNVTITGNPGYVLIVDAGAGNNSVTSSVPLTLTGTQGNDSVDIGQIGTTVTFNVNGATTNLVGATAVRFSALGGDDTITLHGLTVPAAIDAGA